MMRNFFYLYDIFFESNQNFTTEHVKIVKIPGFFNDFCSKFQVFSGYLCLNCRIPGKVATLRLENVYYDNTILLIKNTFYT